MAISHTCVHWKFVIFRAAGLLTFLYSIFALETLVLIVKQISSVQLASIMVDAIVLCFIQWVSQFVLHALAIHKGRLGLGLAPLIVLNRDWSSSNGCCSLFLPACFFCSRNSNKQYSKYLDSQSFMCYFTVVRHVHLRQFYVFDKALSRPIFVKNYKWLQQLSFRITGEMFLVPVLVLRFHVV